MKVAVCQSPVTAEISANGRAIRKLIGEAADRGARLAVFCESALSGFAKEHVLSWSSFDWGSLDREMASIAALCRERGVFAAVGTAQRIDGDHPPHNSLLIISDRGERIACYDKRFLSNSELRGWYTPGDGSVTFSVDGYLFGCAICIETQFPELFIDYERLGVDAVLFPSMSLPPFFLTSTLAHAGHNCIWIAAATCTNAAEQGPSGIAGPDGKWMAQCAPAGQLAIAEIDRADPAFDIALNRARPWRAAARQGDIYRAAAMIGEKA
ncbi:MAG: carbon-nitrogen hydrolase family protein [Ahrensia sp.]|nr:carbon-nitrogen hydrolase family protein [Ahrensia sp.]|tara:strand:+ start:14552 stop:15355 length:804 start_codon:yes stop_codon:yes gene_type:complete